jgi:hypothetical protein
LFFIISERIYKITAMKQNSVHGKKKSENNSWKGKIIQAKDNGEQIRTKLWWLRMNASTGSCEQSSELSGCENRTGYNIRRA